MVAVLEVNDKMLSENFSELEFVCKCGECLFDVWVDPVFIKKLQTIRTMIGISMPINSGARCEAHNKKVGGHPNSAHLITPLKKCQAADISTLAMSSKEKRVLIRLALANGMNGVGISSRFIHLDTKKREALWTYV
jgi:uncharacterized protein YcbK (DUF882 family)